MARPVEEARLDSREARRRLEIGRGLHLRTLVPGKSHLGYRRRRRDAPGTWLIRTYTGSASNPYAIATLGMADDMDEADGIGILSYTQALERAGEQARAPRTEQVPTTVREVVEAYIARRDARDSERHGRTVRSDASRRLSRYVLGQPKRGRHEAVPPAPLADVRLTALREADLRSWRTSLPDTLRETTVERLVNDLKAALNAGHRRHRESLDAKFPETVEFGLKPDDDHSPAKSEPVSRDQILTDEQVGRLVAAAREVDDEGQWEGDLLRMVLVLAATGARFSQVARLTVGDCQLDAGRLLVPVSNKGRGRKEHSTVAVPIGEDVVAALRPVVAGRAPDERLLERWRVRQVGPVAWERTGRGPWQASSELGRPWALVRERAKLPSVIPYALRHSSIVRGIRANLPIRLVAAAHDTSIGMIEKHYSRFITSGLEDMLRTAIVPLVPGARGDNVTPIRGRS